MYNTLKMMKSILTGEEVKVNEKELINRYKQDLLPNILAYFYASNFNLIYKTSKLYPILDDEDKASFCLQELDKCLQTYKLESSNKFITYFMKCFKNRLRMETEQLLVQKRKSILNYVNIDDELDLFDTQDSTDTKDILNDYNLSELERKQCILLDAGYTLKEIAHILKQTTSTIYKRNSVIKQKILKYNINFA